MTDTVDVGQLLECWQSGDEGAFEELIPLVYDELRRLAHHHIVRERSDHTLSTTALVHEAYFCLVNVDSSIENRSHFFGIASQIMRRVLVDYARKSRAEKRGSGRRAELLKDDSAVVNVDLDTVIAVDDALRELHRMDKRLCRVVECRYFTGLTIGETANVLNIAPATVKRDWITARAWLKTVLEPGETQ